MPTDESRPVGMTDSQRKRLAETVRRVESGNPPGQGGRIAAALWNPGVVRAKVTVEIPTGSFASPSTSGMAQIFHKDATRAWVESGDPVVVNNDHTISASVAVDSPVKLTWIDGEWWLNIADCPS